MYSRLHRKLGTAGLVVAIVALVAALSGAAIAAGGLTSQQEKQVTKIAKKYAGKQGPQGNPGATGATGATGAPGAKGDKGDPGSAGGAGPAGKSVVIGTATAGECPGSNPAGGATVEVEGSGSKKKICNGKEGSPWTAGGTLPGGKTETGVWVAGQGPAFGGWRVPISFSIPLAGDLAASKVHYINVAGKEVIDEFGTEQTSTACHGTAAAPSADIGHLCVYGGEESSLFGFTEAIFKVDGATKGASTAGAILQLFLLNNEAYGAGSWAVRAEE